MNHGNRDNGASDVCALMLRIESLGKGLEARGDVCVFGSEQTNKRTSKQANKQTNKQTNTITDQRYSKQGVRSLFKCQSVTEINGGGGGGGGGGGVMSNKHTYPALTLD